MPLPKGTRYRWKGNVRLAFRGRTVVEAKNLETGAVHTPAEFAAERRAAGKGRTSMAKKSRAKSVKVSRMGIGMPQTPAQMATMMRKMASKVGSMGKGKGK